MGSLVEKNIYPIFESACRTGDTSILLESIINKEFDVNCAICNEYGDTYPAWMAAVERGNAKVLKLLLEKGAKISYPNYLQCLRGSIYFSNYEVVEILLQFGVQSKIMTEKDYISSFEAVQCALTRQNVSRVLFFNPVIRSRGEQKCIKVIKIILEYGSQQSSANIDSMSKCRKLFLFCKAIFENDLNKVSTMLSEGNLEYFKIVRKCYRPASFAILLEERSEILKLFLQKRVNLEEIFLKCIEMRNQDLMKLSLERGVDPRTKNTVGQDALTLSCIFNNIDAFILLVEQYNVMPEEMNFEGLPPLFQIKEADFMKTVLDRFPKTDINQQDHRGNTLLGLDLNCEIFEILLKYGVDPNIKNKEDDYPYHNCLNRNENCKVITYIEKLRIIDPDYADHLISKVFFEDNFPDWKQWTIEEKLDCEAELEQLRKIQISIAFMDQSSQSLFDFMFFKPHKTARYSKNEIISKLHQDCGNDFEKMYKNYGFILNYQLRKGQRRSNLMESARETLHSAFGSEVPDEITDEIFKHFTNKEIERFSQSE